MGVLKSIPRSSSSILCVGVLGIVGALAFTAYKARNRFVGTENYEIGYVKKFKDWKVLPKTPESLFIFQNRKNGMLLRGSETQVIAEVNPTPELDTDSLAQFYIDRTKDNMPDWTAKRMDDLRGENIRFSVIERDRKDQAVMTAFAAKGNTTLMVSISARNKTDQLVQSEKDALADCVKQISFTQKDMGGGSTAELEAEKESTVSQ